MISSCLRFKRRVCMLKFDYIHLIHWGIVPVQNVPLNRTSGAKPYILGLLTVKCHNHHKLSHVLSYPIKVIQGAQRRSQDTLLALSNSFWSRHWRNDQSVFQEVHQRCHSRLLLHLKYLHKIHACLGFYIQWDTDTSTEKETKLILLLLVF